MAARSSIAAKGPSASPVLNSKEQCGTDRQRYHYRTHRERISQRPDQRGAESGEKRVRHLKAVKPPLRETGSQCVDRLRIDKRPRVLLDGLELSLGKGSSDRIGDGLLQPG